MRLTENVVCRGCGAPATQHVHESGTVEYEATRNVRKATVEEDGSIAVVVDRDHDGDDFFANFDSHGFRCDRCETWGRTVLDVVERELVPEVGDRFFIPSQRRNGVVEDVVFHKQRATEVVIDGATYDFRRPEELELVEPNPHQIPLPIGGNA